MQTIIDVSDCLTVDLPSHVELVIRYADGGEAHDTI